MPGIQTEIPRTHRVKVIVAGEQYVGKSALVSVLVSGAAEFPRNYGMTTVPEVRVKEFPVPKSADTVELLFVDSPGCPLYAQLLKDAWPTQALLVLVYDIANQASYNKLGVWYDTCQHYTSKSLPGLLIGTKSDLSARRFVSSAIAAEFAVSNGLLYYECSPKENTNVVDAFRALALEYHKGLKK